MALTKIEKLILINQYELLKRMDPAPETWEVLLTCLYQGYDNDFFEIAAKFDTGLREEVRIEVRDILEMFRALYPNAGQRENPVPAVFAGFDGNDETAHYAYARFLLEDRGLWGESKRLNYNTHYPVLEDYRKMLLEWRSSSDCHALDDTDIQRIVSKAPHLSKPEGNL